MKRRYIVFIALAVVVAVLVIVNLRAWQRRALAVQTEAVTQRDLSEVISASGSIRPKTKVDISASTIGKVTTVAVKEGDIVQQGQFLLQIDPIELESTVTRLEAMLASAKSNEKEAALQAEQSKSDYDRAQKLLEGGYRTSQEVDAARTTSQMAEARLESIKHEIAQHEANLAAARHSLKEVTITAPMSGIITRRNVEPGEIAIMGTLNNAGTVLLTIADLSTIEIEVEVDETEVSHIKLGDRAKVTLDAYPDTSFTGAVTEIGNSPIVTAGTSIQQQGVDFKVVITINGTIPKVRPGLSGDADITVATVKQVATIPIQSLTVRRKRDLKGWKSTETLAASGAKTVPAAGASTAKAAAAPDSAAAKSAPAPAESTASSDTAKTEEGEKELEGVFIVKAGRAHFVPVKVGISSQKYFQVLSGLSSGDQVISGNYKAIREVKDGERVKVTAKAEKAGAGKEQEKTS
jgi:HlyD family secretion protein